MWQGYIWGVGGTQRGHLAQWRDIRVGGNIEERTGKREVIQSKGCPSAKTSWERYGTVECVCAKCLLFASILSTFCPWLSHWRFICKAHIGKQQLEGMWVRSGPCGEFLPYWWCSGTPLLLTRFQNPATAPSFKWEQPSGSALFLGFPIPPPISWFTVPLLSLPWIFLISCYRGSWKQRSKDEGWFGLVR